MAVSVRGIVPPQLLLHPEISAPSRILANKRSPRVSLPLSLSLLATTGESQPQMTKEDSKRPPKEEPAKCTLRFSHASKLIPFKSHDEDAADSGPRFHVVCDGVGGTKGSSAPFARQLVETLSETLQAAPWKKRERETTDNESKKSKKKKKRDRRRAFQEEIEMAIMRAVALCGEDEDMASTISIAYIDTEEREEEKEGSDRDNKGDKKKEETALLRTLTLGDSKTIVVRDDEEIVFETESVVIGFNYPLSMSSSTQSAGRLRYLHYEEFRIRRGDLILSFSDGVHDNLFADELVSCCQSSLKARGAAAVAMAVARTAKRVSKERNHPLNPISILGARAYFSAAKKAVEEESSFSNLEHMKRAASLVKRMVKGEKEKARRVLDKERLVFKDGSKEFYSLDALWTHARRVTGKEDDISVCATVVY